MVKKWWSRLREHFRQVLETKHSPHAIASGFSIGTFLALLPTFGLGLLLGLLVMMVYKRISKYAMVAAFVVWNPLVQPPLYALSYIFGEWMFGSAPRATYNIEILNVVHHVTRRYLTGMVLIAAAVALLCYPPVFLLARRYLGENSEASA